jgi:hypothetical protein
MTIGYGAFDRSGVVPDTDAGYQTVVDKVRDPRAGFGPHAGVVRLVST